MNEAAEKTEMSVNIEGTYLPEFEPVREAFAANFEEREEVGAALCIYRDGEAVLDLWGGIASEPDRTPWRRDTVCPIDSVSKSLTAICALILVDEGKLDLDQPVADYWPEFATAGKREIPVRQLLTHQAGLPAIDMWITLDDCEAWSPMVDALARQKPFWTPGTAHGYHALTFGWLVGEVICRVSGLRPGQFLQERVSPRLGGLDTWIGLPEEIEPRVAQRIQVADESILTAETGNRQFDEVLHEMTELQQIPAFLEGVTDPAKRASEIFDANSGLTLAQRVSGPREATFGNSRRDHSLEIPAGSGISDARSLAKIYSSLIDGVGGRPLIGEDTLDEATRVHAEGPDEVLKLHTAWGLGFCLPGSEMLPPDMPPRSFGGVGAIGALAFGDRDSHIAVGYVRNRALLPIPDPHSSPLVRAIRDCV